MGFTNRVLKDLMILLVPLLIFLIVFTGLDQGEQLEPADVIIIPEGASIRAYKAVDLLLDGYSAWDQLIVSSATEHNAPNYLETGAEREQLVLEEDSTSTWTNATNSVEIMEENNWDSALVVPTDYHTRRTHLPFERATFGKGMDFTYVSTYYEDDNRESLSYLEHQNGWVIGARETAKYFGYLFGLYHIIDMD